MDRYIGFTVNLQENNNIRDISIKLNNDIELHAMICYNDILSLDRRYLESLYDRYKFLPIHHNTSFAYMTNKINRLIKKFQHMIDPTVFDNVCIKQKYAILRTIEEEYNKLRLSESERKKSWDKWHERHPEILHWLHM